MSQAFWVSASSQILTLPSSARSGVKRKASPAEAPGIETALIASTTTRTTSDGIRKRAAVSIPRTPLATTSTPRPTAIPWKTIACGVELKAPQNSPGTDAGISPESVATKKRIVHPITTV